MLVLAFYEPFQSRTTHALVVNIKQQAGICTCTQMQTAKFAPEHCVACEIVIKICTFLHVKRTSDLARPSNTEILTGPKIKAKYFCSVKSRDYCKAKPPVHICVLHLLIQHICHNQDCLHYVLFYLMVYICTVMASFVSLGLLVKKEYQATMTILNHLGF